MDLLIEIHSIDSLLERTPKVIGSEQKPFNRSRVSQSRDVKHTDAVIPHYPIGFSSWKLSRIANSQITNH